MPVKKIINNFYALLEDNSIKKIILTQAITQSIRDTFIKAKEALLNEYTEEILFDGKYQPQENEISYVPMELPENFQEVQLNSIGISPLDLTIDKMKAIFWYEDQEYYFQTFDKRKLLNNRSIIYFSNDTYTKLEQNAFVIDNLVNAIYKNSKFYFHSYPIANRIFSLLEYYQEATNEDLQTFCTNENIVIDPVWLVDNSNSIIRKHITFLQGSGILKSANTKKIRTSAKKFQLGIELDLQGRIMFPQDPKSCREILSFLNEHYYIGLITGNKYKTNSNRKA